MNHEWLYQEKLSSGPHSAVLALETILRGQSPAFPPQFLARMTVQAQAHN